MSLRKKVNNIFFIVGVAAIVVMLFTFDVSFVELWRDICHAGYWLIPIIGLWAFLYVLNCLSWRAIIKGSGPLGVGFLTLQKITISGFALNYTTPGGLMGGEAYRIMELSPYIGVQRATSSVVLFFMMHVFSHFWFWLTAIVVYCVLAYFGIVGLATPVAVVLVLAFVFCLGGIYLFMRGYKYGLIVKLTRFLSHLPGLKKWGQRFLEAHLDDLLKIDRQIAELQSQNRRSFFVSFFLEYIGRILQSFEIFFMLLIFGLDGGGTAGGYALTFVFAFLILAFTSLFANLLGFVPLQLGGREGGFALSVSGLGMTAEIGIFVSIICRVRELFWTTVGILLMKIPTPQPKNKPAEKA